MKNLKVSLHVPATSGQCCLMMPAGFFLLEGFAAYGGVVDDYDGHDDVNHGEW